jgi:hypothetical protein
VTQRHRKHAIRLLNGPVPRGHPSDVFPTATGQVPGARSQSRPVRRRRPSRSADRPLMAPAGISRPLTGYPDLPYRLSETGRILYSRSAYLAWTHQVPTAMSCSFVRARHSVAAEAPVTLQSHPCYVVPQTSR